MNRRLALQRSSLLAAVLATAAASATCAVGKRASPAFALRTPSGLSVQFPCSPVSEYASDGITEHRRYRCEHAGENFDVHQTFADAPPELVERIARLAGNHRELKQGSTVWHLRATFRDDANRAAAERFLASARVHAAPLGPGDELQLPTAVGLKTFRVTAALSKPDGSMAIAVGSDPIGDGVFPETADLELLGAPSEKRLVRTDKAGALWQLRDGRFARMRSHVTGDRLHQAVSITPHDDAGALLLEIMVQAGL